MSAAGPGPTGVPAAPSGAHRPRIGTRIPRRRRGEVLLGAVCAIAVPVSLLLVTGFVPGVYPASPLTFSQQFPTCVSAGYIAPIVTEYLPAWASVSVHWVVLHPTNTLIDYSVQNAAGTVLYQLGSNGTGSFGSRGGEYAFSGEWAGFYLEPVNGSCATVDVQVTVSYTLA